jgi:hypothetical protein
VGSRPARRGRRRWLAALVLLAGLVALAAVALDSASPIVSYRVLGERSIAVTTTEGTGSWTRVARVQESATTVTVEIRSIRIQLGPGTGVGILTESIVGLRDPLGGRAVIDGRTGLPVPARP